ncbi:Helix-turn-helix domain-containing protein [Bacillus sp. 491mf]|uniref:helix-turn-helix transcriptional regulator n=1 Tax=Bacillus sp. 491mf TaxID=1761755 RepID=UPI0008E12FC9|nr:helix-turn-helix transcriptional regulator [Bacillus sp. 491mf]SFD13811.1 Helix-turn-helix domain-containing protein [Bacillus sp. 491mf]
MGIGKIIYYHRKKQCKTQEQLCRGICSVTHLSKIENNSKEANLDTLKLLCERLGVSVEEEERKIQDFQKKIDAFYDAIERLNKGKANSLYNFLNNHKEYISCTKLIFLYELCELRYYLFLDQLDEVEKRFGGINRYKRKFSQYERYLSDFLYAIYYFKRKELTTSLKVLNDISESVEIYSDKIKEYYYYQALVHSKLNHSTLAIYFGYKALKVFQETSNIYRILHVKTIIAIHLIRTGEYKTAETVLLEMLDDAELIQNVSETARTLHNLGFLYYSQKKPAEALDYYYKSLQLKQKYTEDYYLTLGNIAQILVEMQEYKKVVEMLKEELYILENKESPEYVRLNVLYLQALGEEELLIHYLIRHGLPIMERENQLKEALEYAEKISFYYEESDLLLSNQYLRISNNILKSLLSNKGEYK